MWAKMLNLSVKCFLENSKLILSHKEPSPNVVVLHADEYVLCDSALREGLVVDYASRNRPGIQLIDPGQSRILHPPLFFGVVR